jgi:hypothetical protein
VSRSRVLALVALVIAVAAAGCGECLTVVCLDVLRVTLSRPVEFPYRVEISSASDTVVRVHDCPDAFACPGLDYDFQGIVTDTVRVRVVTPTRTIVHDVVPQYTLSFPPANRCGPACRSGKAIFTPD